MRTPPLVVAFFLSTIVGAQCTMQVNGTYAASCFTADIGWTITNGTPPYDVSVFWQGAEFWSGSSNQTIGGVVLSVGTTVQAIVMVEDGAGCTSADTLDPDVAYIFNSADCCLETQLDGQQGTATLRWTTLPGTACAPEALTYTIRSLPSGDVFTTGLIGDAWTYEEATGDWVYDMLLPSGQFQAEITGEVDCGSFYTFPAVDCWRSDDPLELWVPTPGNPGVNVAVRMALGGPPMAGGLMNDALRAAGLVPLVDPYPGLGYAHTAYTGNGSISPGMLAITGDNAVVDWVLVELRHANSPYAVLGSKPVLLQRDQDVMDLDGDPFVNISGMTAGQYRIALRHRNHLGVMTDPIELGTAVTLVNTTSTATGLYGGPTAAGLGRRLWPGNVTFDGVVKYVGPNNDRDPILQAVGGSTPTNVVSNVYNRADTNLDGSIRYVGANNDRDVILQTVGGSVPTATRVQQLP